MAVLNCNKCNTELGRNYILADKKNWCIDCAENCMEELFKRVGKLERIAAKEKLQAELDRAWASVSRLESSGDSPVILKMVRNSCDRMQAELDEIYRLEKEEEGQKQ